MLSVTCPPASASLADWMQGIGATVAVGISFVLLYLEGMTRRQATRQEFYRQPRGMQVGQPPSPGGSTSALIPGPGWKVEPLSNVEIHNQSQEAFTDVVVAWEVVAPGVDGAENVRGTLPPTRINAGKSATFSLTASIATQTREPMPRIRFAVTVDFTDSMGNRWRREPDHRLTLLKDIR